MSDQSRYSPGLEDSRLPMPAPRLRPRGNRVTSSRVLTPGTSLNRFLNLVAGADACSSFSLREVSCGLRVRSREISRLPDTTGLFVWGRTDQRVTDISTITGDITAPRSARITTGRPRRECSGQCWLATDGDSEHRLHSLPASNLVDGAAEPRLSGMSRSAWYGGARLLMTKFSDDSTPGPPVTEIVRWDRQRWSLQPSGLDDAQPSTGCGWLIGQKPFPDISGDGGSEFCRISCRPSPSTSREDPPSTTVACRCSMQN